MFSDFPEPGEGKAGRGVPSVSGGPQLRVSAHPARRSVLDRSLVTAAAEKYKQDARLFTRSKTSPDPYAVFKWATLKRNCNWNTFKNTAFFFFLLQVWCCDSSEAGKKKKKKDGLRSRLHKPKYWPQACKLLRTERYLHACVSSLAAVMLRLCPLFIYFFFF